MGRLGCGFSILAIVFAIVATLPLLGWANWFATLPAAVLAIIFSGIALLGREQRTLAVLGMIAGVGVRFFAMCRLIIGRLVL